MQSGSQDLKIFCLEKKKCPADTNMHMLAKTKQASKQSDAEVDHSVSNILFTYLWNDYGFIQDLQIFHLK